MAFTPKGDILHLPTPTRLTLFRRTNNDTDKSEKSSKLRSCFLNLALLPAKDFAGQTCLKDLYSLPVLEKWHKSGV